MVGARKGLQETEEFGTGFEGWYWTNIVTRVETMGVCWKMEVKVEIT